MNKKLGILILLTLVVWGAIGYRVYDALTKEEDPIVIRRQKAVADTLTHTQYTLLLSYPDPFLKKTFEVPHSASSAPATTKKRPVYTPVQTEADPYIDWNKVEYLGSVRNARTGLMIATIKIADKEYLVREQQQADLFLVASIHADSIGLSFHNKIKYIKRKK